jgi:hypothetical protein
MKTAIALLALSLLAGCTGTGTVSPRGIEGPVALGQVAYVGGPRVRPDRLVEDSRCPADTQCIWAGRVVVRATVFGGSWSREIELTLGEPVAVADGRLTLVSVQPERTSGEKPQELRFTFAFEGGV